MRNSFKRTGRYDFTPKELDDMKSSIPPMIREIEGTKAMIASIMESVKNLKTKAEFIQNETAKISKKIEDGYEERQLDCVRFKSYRKEVWIYVDRLTHREVTREPFGVSDSQVSLGELIWPEEQRPPRLLESVMLEIESIEHRKGFHPEPAGGDIFEEVQESQEVQEAEKPRRWTKEEIDAYTKETMELLEKPAEGSAEPADSEIPVEPAEGSKRKKKK